MISYEKIIDEVIRVNKINCEEVLVSKNGEVVTIRDFIEKSKKMVPWHNRLIDNLCDIQAENGDVLKFLREYTKDKMNSGFSFKEKNSKDRIEIKIKLRNKSEIQEFLDIIQAVAKKVEIKLCKSGIVVAGNEMPREGSIPGDLLISFPSEYAELCSKMEKFV